MSLISLNWDKHLIYAIIFWILEITIDFVKAFRWDFFQMSESAVQNEYIILILAHIADLLSIFLVLYIHCSFRKQNNIKKSNNESSLIYKDYEKSQRKSLIKKMIIISIIDYLSRCVYWIFYAITGADYNDVFHQLQRDVSYVIDIFMRYLFSIYILNIVILKHRKVSLISIIIGFCILLPADIVLLKRDKNTKTGLSLVYTAIIALKGIFFPLEDTMTKKLFTEEFILPEKFMLIKSCFGSIILVITTPILYFSFRISLKLTFNTKQIITAVIYVLADFVKSYCLLKIIYHFSSQSVSFLVMSRAVAGTITQIINFIKDNKNKDPVEIILLIIETIGILIISFATLLYDEIIIINKWGLNENVKKGIISRGEEDVITTIELEITRDITFDENFLPDDCIKENLQNEI